MPVIIKGGSVTLHTLCGNVQSFLQAYIKQANKFIRGFGCCDNHIVSIRGVNMFGYIQLTREERQYNKYFMSRI